MQGTSAAREPAGISIREAAGADAPALAEFNRAMARETEALELDPETVAAGVAAALADPARAFYLIAERDGEALGALMVTSEWSDWRNAAFWWIQSVYVRPEARRQGIYALLHRAVRERAGEHGGVCGLRLYVERENHAAQRCYRGQGMDRSAYLLYEEEFER